MPLGHTHTDDRGLAYWCYCQCKTQLKSARFWFGLTVVNTLEFLPEHLIWFRLWPFYLLAHYLHLS